MAKPKRESSKLSKREESQYILVSYEASLQSHLELGIRDHIDSQECWCEPELIFRNPETGTLMLSHRDLYVVH